MIEHELAAPDRKPQRDLEGGSRHGLIKLAVKSGSLLTLVHTNSPILFFSR
jgi:hypothetical protein